MGHKSKFTFPMPGRSAKQPPTVTISNPLSKAEKILGTGGMSLGSPTATRDPGRSWETSSNGGISISISESSASQSGVLDGDEDGFAGTTYGRNMWEEESEALPRRLRGAHGPFGKSLKPKRSAVTLGARSRDNTTDDSNSRRPQSSSTTYSHYESTKVPLSISQQTSNSAMAKGLPSKASTLLDIDGALYGNGQTKKKPSKLDFSKLRLRSRKDQNADPNGIGPVLGNNYVMRSPSIMSHMSHSIVSPTRPSPTSPGSQITPKQDVKMSSQPPSVASTRPVRLKGKSDANTLHQLYDHYEQMSFRYATDLKEEDEEDEEIIEKVHSSQQHLPTRTYVPEAPDTSREDMATPLPNPTSREQNARWNHSRNTSQASKTTATRSGTPSTLQIRPTSRHDYPASISSRHTRTSKATPSIMSTLDSDRQQHSVLSLSDSDSDEDGTNSRTGSSLPSYDNNSFRDDLSVSSSQQQGTSRLSVSSHSTNPKGASYAQLNDYLTIPHASPKAKSSRSTSTNTLHSSNSSLSTATRGSLPSHQDPRASVSTSGTGGSIISPTYSTQTMYSVQEARTIAYTPYTSTAEAASSVSGDHMSMSSLNQALSQQARQRVSQNSHTSDQPTPPLSPTSVEFYKKSPESVRQEPTTAGKSNEPHNARLMAVTRQEEMLLAALRKKRARMRENILAEIEEDRGTHRGGGSHGTIDDFEHLASANLRDAERQAAKEVKEAREAHTRAKQPRSVTSRSSSLMGRSSRASANGHGHSHGSRPARDHSSGSRGTDRPPSTGTGRSEHAAERSSIRSSRKSPEPESQSRRGVKARHERVLLYLDRPIDSIDVIDQAEPSPDLSEFLDEELDFPMPERRSRTRSKLGTSVYGNGHEAVGRPRPDSSPMSPMRNPVKTTTPNTHTHTGKAGHDRGVSEVNEDIDADDVDFDDFDAVADRRRKGPLRSVPEMDVARPDSPVAKGDGMLTPSVFGHKKGKKSAVRLSAVGQISSPVPWWGDDD
ncbi:hypothetical protein GGS26DRAFT_380289 [Hypomontagnella submonticulosa]|nr:hypothetical protein GGS26DRAFT_380289 [Hypomontagnella submonticulosa]